MMKCESTFFLFTLKNDMRLVSPTIFNEFIRLYSIEKQIDLLAYVLIDAK